MAFSRAFLEEIKNRCDLEEIIGRHVQLKRAGSNVVGLCPFHNEKTPSFTIFPSSGNFYCFGCGTGGDVVTFIMKTEGLEYPEAIEYLAKFSGIPIEENDFPRSEKPTVKKDRIIKITTEAAKFFRECLFSGEGKAARDYLSSRNFSEKTIKRFGLGYAPDSWDRLALYLKDKGYDSFEAKTAFLTGTGKKGTDFDIFRNRLMFPIFDLQSEVVAFSGRRLNEKDERKYINTSDTPAFKKSKVLFGMNIAKNTKEGSFILCEGAPDAIMLHQAGFSNAIATLGTAITSEHARLIERFNKKVYLSYDIDKAGKTATIKGIDLLNQLGIETRVINLNADTKDPDEFIKKYGANAFKNKIVDAQGQVDYRITDIFSNFDLSSPDERLRALKAVTDYISTFWSKSQREIFSQKAAEILKLEKASVFDDVEKKSKINAKKQKKEIADKSVREHAGYGDTVNRDRLRYSREAMVEEAVIGILFNRRDLSRSAAETIEAGDFFTELNKKIYSAFYEDFINGREVLFSENGALNQDEISRAIKYMASRRAAGDDNPEQLAALINKLKEYRRQRDADKKIEEDPGLNLSEYINKARNDRQTKGK